jgi:RND family efflux transporter MFP subunit
VSGFVAEAEPFTRQIEESGTLTGNKEATIAAETGGRVLRIFVDVGDKVRTGEPLVQLDDELYRLESERAKIAFDKAQMDLDRLEKLYADKSISESDIESARLGVKSAEVQYRMALKTYNDATIRAPFSGTVAARLTEVGQTMDRGMPVIQLVDLSTLKLVVPVSEADVKFIAPGADATIIVESVGDTLPGKVAAVGSRATAGARTFPVEVRLAGSNSLRSGMFARAIIATATQENALLLPRVAILPDAGNTVVFLAHGAMARKARVNVIGNAGDFVAVEGIDDGDTVLTTGNQLLTHGSPIALTLHGREVSAR